MLPRDFIAHSARSFPDQAAYIDGERSCTWHQIDERSDRLAAGLQRLGVRKGDAVAILSHDHLEMLEHWYACMKIGAVRTGINWRYSDREMLHIIHDSDAKVLIIQANCIFSLQAHLPDLRQEGRELVGFGDGHGLATDYEDLMEEAGSPETPDLDEEDLIAISYTSGTTGLPKGVLLTQVGVREALTHTALAAGLRNEDIWLNALPMAGAPLLITSLNLVNGMTSVLPGGDFDPQRFLELLQHHEVTSALLVPTMLRRVVEIARDGNFDTTSLGLMVYGSMPTTPSLIREAYETFEGCEFQQWYGTSEGTGGWFTFLRDGDHRKALADEPELLTSCGTPGLHVEMSVRDPESGEELPIGETGEVWVAGDVVMRGYLGLPEENEEVFAGRWLRTGDLGHFDQRGYLYLVDRKKFMIISGGYNVFPVVIENVLADHPAVREVTVVGAPHPEWGEVVVGVVSLLSGEKATREELIDFCRNKVGKWEVPKHIEIVDGLPKGTTAKIQKHEVRAWFRDQPERLPWHTLAET